MNHNITRSNGFNMTGGVREGKKSKNELWLANQKTIGKSTNI